LESKITVVAAADVPSAQGIAFRVVRIRGELIEAGNSIFPRGRHSHSMEE
jgi:hypothetical protein